MVVGSRIHCSILKSITLLAAYWCQIGSVFVASFVNFKELRHFHVNTSFRHRLYCLITDWSAKHSSAFIDSVCEYIPISCLSQRSQKHKDAH